MVCPDTAYAALAPVSAGRKLSVLFGVYAGFKLLVPAGPAIVATTLGGLTPKLVAWGAIAFFASWAVGLLYARYHEGTERPGAANPGEGLSMAFALPLAVLISLIAVGTLIKWRSIPVLPLIDFLIGPKGALFLAAFISLCFLDAAGRAKALDSGVRRTAPLLLTIGAASALGTMLVKILSFDQFAMMLVSTGLVLPALFALTVAFKLAKGSSMATFAGTSGIVAALLPSLGVSPEAATLAMCTGAFVAIAPNDSLYWLARQDAFAEGQGARATSILAIGTTLQGLVAFSVIGLAVWSGLL